MSGAVPQLRFPQFEGDWPHRPLADLATIKTGSRDTQNRVEDGAYPFFVRSDTVERINSYALDCEAVLTSGDGVGVGRNFHYINGRFDYHQRVYAIYGFGNELIGPFFYQFFRESFLSRVMRLSAKNSVDSVRMSMISEMETPCPSLPEQQKIADFLGTVDAKLDALRRKKSGLEALKSGLMQRLFSQELRFAQDDGTEFPDWEGKTLGELGSFSKGKGISKADITEEGELPCIRYGELYTQYSERITEIVSRTDVPASSLTLSQINDVIIPASGETPIDMARACCVLVAGVALGGDINIFRSHLNGEYLAYLLTNARRTEIAQMAQGNSVVHLYPAQLRQIVVPVPHPDEQRKIADALSALDTKIAALAGQITHMDTFKKGLLQQMFV